MTLGWCTANPSSLPAASEEVTTDVAPLWRSRWTFSSSRTAATIVAVGFSSRAVSVVSTAVSSRLTATTIELASRTPAWRSTSVDAELPETAVSPDAVASARPSGSCSMTTIRSRDVPWASSVFSALRPLTPKPQMMMWSFKVRLQRAWR